jgi:hypothetical protein
VRRVWSEARPHRIVEYDTRTPDDANFTITAKRSCALAISGL